METNQLKKIILEQKKIFEKEERIIQRAIPQKTIKSKKIVVITGIRRSGKSTLLKQISKNYKKFNYFNFEDERLLDFTYKDFNKLLQAFYELNPLLKVYLFDEIQNIKGWEKFVRRLFTEENKIFITGSNAKLLSSDIATTLTGRNLKLELYPFSFKEFLKWQNIETKKEYTTKEESKMAKQLEQYIKYGGFPEIVKSRDQKELIEIYQDIIIKDLIVRFKIRDSKEFRELALYLLSNISKKISYNNLKNLLEFSNTSKVKNYIEFFADSYLFFTIPKFDYSLKKQIKNQKKVYSIDSGIVNTISENFSKNIERLMENIVYLELKRRIQEVYYYENKKECDFVIKKGLKIVDAIQVCRSLSDPKTKQRELQGLLEAINEFKLKTGWIITGDTEKQEKIQGKTITYIPLWKWLLTG